MPIKPLVSLTAELNMISMLACFSTLVIRSFQIATIVVTPGAGHQVPGLTAQFIALFNQVGLKTHVGDR